MAAQVDDKVVDLQGNLRNGAIRPDPAGAQLGAQGVGEKAPGHIPTPGRLLHCGGKGGHRPVVGVHHRTALHHIGGQPAVQGGNFRELLLIVQLGVVPQAVGLVGLAAHNTVLNHHIGEAQADGVKAAQVGSGGLLHGLRSPLHLGQGGVLTQSGTVDLILPPGPVQAARRPEQAGQQQQRAGDLLRQGVGGGEPVKFLAQGQLSIHADSQLYISAANVHAQYHPASGHGGQPVKDGPARHRRGGLYRRLLLHVVDSEGELLLSAEQHRQHPLVDVETLAVAGACGLVPLQLEYPVQPLDQRQGGLVRLVQVHVNAHPSQGGQQVIHIGVDILRHKFFLVLPYRLGQTQVKGPDRPVVEGDMEVEGAGPPGLEGLPDVGNIHALVVGRLLQEGFQHSQSLLYHVGDALVGQKRNVHQKLVCHQQHSRHSPSIQQDYTTGRARGPALPGL